MNNNTVLKAICNILILKKNYTVFQTSDSLLVFTGSIARSASRRYLTYSEADFEVFLPARAKRCTDGGEIWHGGPSVPSSMPNSPHRCNDKGVGLQKLKFLLRFDQNVEAPRRGVSLPPFLQDLQSLYIISGCVRC